MLLIIWAKHSAVLPDPSCMDSLRCNKQITDPKEETRSFIKIIDNLKAKGFYKFSKVIIQ